MLVVGRNHALALDGHNLEGVDYSLERVGRSLEGGPGHERVLEAVRSHIVLEAVSGSRSAKVGLVDARSFAFVDLASTQQLPFPVQPLRLPPSACPPLVATE